jgi:hypothetical protein
MEKWGNSRRDINYKRDILLGVPKKNLGCPRVPPWRDRFLL